MKRATLGFMGVGMVGEEMSAVNRQLPTSNFQRPTFREGNGAEFTVSSRENERAGTMVGAVVLGEKAPVAAVELLRLFQECDRSAGAGEPGGETGFGRCALCALCERQERASRSGAVMATVSEL